MATLNARLAQLPNMLTDAGSLFLNALDKTGAQTGNVPTLGSDGNVTWRAGGGGSAFTAGAGISITNFVISIDGTVTTNTGAQTLTNKTITNPTIAMITNGAAAIMLPSTAGTLALASSVPATPAGGFVGLTAVQTLTNKTLDGGVVLADPISALGIASKQYVDSVVTAPNPKASCFVATTATIILSGTVTIDGQSIGPGIRVLVKDQLTPATNGIYLSNAAAWVRDTDANTILLLKYATVFVSDGTTNAGSTYICLTTAGTLGTTPIVWSVSSRTAAYFGGPGISINGNQIAVDTSVVTLAGTQALSNKTLTAPIMLSFTNGALLYTAPTVAGTLAVTSQVPSFWSGNASNTYQQVYALPKTSGVVSGVFSQLGYTDLFGTQTMASSALVGITDAQILTNKTLVLPVISSISNSGATLTLPIIGGTLALTSQVPAAWQGTPNIAYKSVYLLAKSSAASATGSFAQLDYSDLSSTKTLPAGSIVGTTDAQTMTNKTILSGVYTQGTMGATRLAGVLEDYSSIVQSSNQVTVDGLYNIYRVYRANSLVGITTLNITPPNVSIFPVLATYSFLLICEQTVQAGYIGSISVSGATSTTVYWTGGSPIDGGLANTVDRYHVILYKTAAATYTVEISTGNLS